MAPAASRDPPARAPLLLRERRPSMAAGVAASLASVAGCTGIAFAVEGITAESSLGVLYILPVLLASTYWGLILGLPTSLVSAAAFNVFFLPPTGRITITDSRNVAALTTFIVVALATSRVADLARARAAEAVARRQEADLAAELARGLLAGGDADDLLRMTAHRIAEALGVPSAALQTGTHDADSRRAAFPLQAGGTTVATLLLPADLSAALLHRLTEHVIPSLEALLAAALERDAMQAEVVETQALRRSDVVKTTILRSVSHDLRSPLTSILTAGSALGSMHLSDDDREALSAGVVTEAQRLSHLIDDLLDLSKLEAGTAAPRADWCALEDVLHAAGEHAGGDVSYAIEADLPLLRADAAQLERAFENLVANARKHSGGAPVSVRARQVAGRILIRVVDQGPGISAAAQDRIFEAFWRGSNQGESNSEMAAPGSGLGLAIVRGFVEANGGKVWVESLPGQGASFVVEFPLTIQ